MVHNLNILGVDSVAIATLQGRIVTQFRIKCVNIRLNVLSIMLMKFVVWWLPC